MAIRKFNPDKIIWASEFTTKGEPASKANSRRLVAIEIYYASRRPDLDESLILDAMEKRIYKNDRQVNEKHIYWNLSKDDPYIKIKIAQIDLSS